MCLPVGAILALSGFAVLGISFHAFLTFAGAFTGFQRLRVWRTPGFVAALPYAAGSRLVKKKPRWGTGVGCLHTHEGREVRMQGGSRLARGYPRGISPMLQATELFPRLCTILKE